MTVTDDLGPGGAVHRHLLGVAYRLLGSVHDAEDAVQDALERWSALPEQGDVREPVAWLTTVVSRLSVDRLRSARARRESYAGIWLPEPVLGDAVAPRGAGRAAAPEDAVTLDESVSFALLTAMEQLTPAERTALILHDVFALTFVEVAAILDRTPEACRQLATSARRHLRGRPRFAVDGPERDRAVRAFADACRTGDVDALTRVLAPDVITRSDGGGHVHAARRAVVGADEVARFLLGVLGGQARHGRSPEVAFEPVNGRRGLVLREDGAITAVVDVAVAAGLVAEIAIVLNPDKLPSGTAASKSGPPAPGALQDPGRTSPDS